MSVSALLLLLLLLWLLLLLLLLALAAAEAVGGEVVHQREPPRLKEVEFTHLPPLERPAKREERRGADRHGPRAQSGGKLRRVRREVETAPQKHAAAKPAADAQGALSGGRKDIVP